MSAHAAVISLTRHVQKEYGLEILTDGINYEQTKLNKIHYFTRERIRLKNAGIISVCSAFHINQGNLYNLFVKHNI